MTKSLRYLQDEPVVFAWCNEAPSRYGSVKRKDKGENITRYVFLKLVIRPTKVGEIEVTSAKLKCSEWQGFQQLNWIIRNENSHSICCCE